jgi:hypothetical protein
MAVWTNHVFTTHLICEAVRRATRGGDLAKQLTSKQSLIESDRVKNISQLPDRICTASSFSELVSPSPLICAVGFGYMMHAWDTRIDHQATSCSDEFQWDRSVCFSVYNSCMDFLASVLTSMHRSNQYLFSLSPTITWLLFQPIILFQSNPYHLVLICMHRTTSYELDHAERIEGGIYFGRQSLGSPRNLIIATQHRHVAWRIQQDQHLSARATHQIGSIGST